MDKTELREYRAEDGLEMLKRVKNVYAGAEQACRECEKPDRSFSIFYNDELVGCAGIIHKTDWIGVVWMMADPDPAKLRLIDPQLARDKMFEIRERFNYHRLEAAVREDFSAGHSYMRYLGFKPEGLMIACEPDGSNAFLYARIFNQCEKCGCCCEIFPKLVNGKECEYFDKDKRLCKIYENRPEICRVKNWERNKPYCRQLQSMRI